MDEPLPLPLLPARILNEFTYCPRLAYLEWVQKEWEDNLETLEGTYAHRRVDRGPGDRVMIHDRSVELASEALGIVAKVDLIEREGRRVRPVDYKRGTKPAVAGGAWDPERVQLCAQGLLLREHGYECYEGVLYFVASRQRVRVRFTPQLAKRTLELVASARKRMASSTIPDPLEDSPKCPRCSLVRICLPDEVNFLHRRISAVRPLTASDPATFPLVVQEPGSRVRLRGECLVVEHRGSEVETARLAETSQLVVMGGTACSAPVLRECCRRDIPVVHMSGTGWLYGVTRGLPHKNVELRTRQYTVAQDGRRSLALARALVAAKIRNGRVLLRRNGDVRSRDLALLRQYAVRAEKATNEEELLGVEGSAARLYFQLLPAMLKATVRSSLAFDFTSRNKRPPRDPVNALLSFVYSLLTRDWVTTLYAAGFDPLMGFYHRPRYGKPALALDLMEPFRPVVAESVVIGVLNNGELGAGDFLKTAGGVLLRPGGRKRVVVSYERRLRQKIRHPLFGYSATYRRIFEIQARLLGRYLLDEIPDYPPLRIR